MANKRRLIDTDAFERHLMFSVADEDMCDDCLQYVTDQLMTYPAVDAVIPVRCRECRFAHRIDGPREEYSCRKGYFFTPWFNGDDFCSYGERRCE